MFTFHDNQGREWGIRLTFGLAEEIAQRCERPDSTKENRKTFDLLNVINDEQVEYLQLKDPATGRVSLDNIKSLVNVLYVICEAQCKERSVTDVEFGELLSDSTFGEAYQAFQYELENFILDPAEREFFLNAISLAGGGASAVLSETNRTLTEKKTALVAQTTQIVREKMDSVMDSALQGVRDAVDGTTSS